MAVDNLKVSKEDVQVLFNDSEAVRKMIEEKVQELVRRLPGLEDIY